MFGRLVGRHECFIVRCSFGIAEEGLTKLAIWKVHWCDAPRPFWWYFGDVLLLLLLLLLVMLLLWARHRTCEGSDQLKVPCTHRYSVKLIGFMIQSGLIVAT